MTWQLVVEIAVAAVAGASSGYFAPWFAWSIEQKRETRGFRRQLVESWRRELLDKTVYLSKTDPKNPSEVGFVSGKYVSSQVAAVRMIELPAFSSIKPHLSADFQTKLRELLNSRAIHIEGGGSPFSTLPWICQSLQDEIARVERSWHLV